MLCTNNLQYRDLNVYFNCTIFGKTIYVNCTMLDFGYMGKMEYRVKTDTN